MSNNNINRDNKILVAKTGVDNNVVIIDPNKVFDNNTGMVIDRNINQEDLVLYANLRIIKKPATQIFHNALDNKYDVINENELNILMLNPIKNINDGTIKYKNNLTVDYTDYFTTSNLNNSNKSNLGTYNELKNYFDPETFGITSISISQNASFKPIVTMEFVDVQGKTLFESGDHPNNPYNFFYSLPYPTFILTVKGFYGKTIDLPLVLLKTSTKFDPESGSYRITAEFLSRTFSIYNNFLMIYAYLAPKMFKKDDGNYVGFEILKQIYDQQNDYYSKLYNDKLDKRNRYVFKNGTYPTLSDIAKVKETLSSNSSLDDNETQTASSSVNELDAAITILKQRYDEIIGNVQPNLEDLYKKSIMEIINNTINNLSDIETKTEIYNQCSLVNNGVFFDAQNKLIKDTILMSENIKYFKDLFQKIFIIIEGSMTTLNEIIINKKIINLKNKLGYVPNAHNISRIVFNNIQAFLILMNIALKKSLYQIQNNIDDNNNKRLLYHELHGEYNETGNGDKYYEPFPNYYIEEKRTDSQDKTYKKVYPGYHTQNQGWAEVEFIDEIMKSIDVLKIESGNKSDTIGDTEVFPLSSFDIKSDRISAYTKSTNHIQAVTTMLDRLQLLYIYSGFVFKNISDTKISSYIKQIQESELDYFTNIVLNELDVTKKIEYATNLLSLIDSDKPVEKLSGTLTSNLSTDELKKLKDEVRSDILKSGGENLSTIYRKYKKINTTITDLLSSKVSPIMDTIKSADNGTVSTTPIYLFDNYKSNSNYYVTPNVNKFFSDSSNVLSGILKEAKIGDQTYLYNPIHYNVIITGATTNDSVVVNSFNYDTTINDGDAKYKTLTTTINDNNILIKLIGYDNSVLANTNTKTKYNF